MRFRWAASLGVFAGLLCGGAVACLSDDDAEDATGRDAGAEGAGDGAVPSTPTGSSAATSDGGALGSSDAGTRSGVDGGRTDAGAPDAAGGSDGGQTPLPDAGAPDGSAPRDGGIDSGTSSCAGSCSPPPTTCAPPVITTYSVASCTAGCQYATTPTTCALGCSKVTNACNTTDVTGSFVSLAPDGNPADGTTPTTTSGGSPTTIAPTVMPLLLVTPQGPEGATESISVTYAANDQFTGATTAKLLPSVTDLNGGGIEAWSTYLPSQTSGTQIYFYVQVLTYGGADLYSPGNFVNYTYRVQ